MLYMKVVKAGSLHRVARDAGRDVNPSHHAHAPSPYLVSEDNLLSKLCDRKHRELTLDNQ
jgi:hypothetical protein